ncbi:MAG TPA: hypothetical protein VI386_18660 [Candidatus Sulfotelmatobacter sp.]
MLEVSQILGSVVLAVEGIIFSLLLQNPYFLVRMVLALSSRQRRIPVLIFVSLALVGFWLYFLGWEIVVLAFTESLSDINQTIGGAVFAVIVLLTALAWEAYEYKVSPTFDFVLKILGKGVVAALVAWVLFFMFKLAVGVPIEIRRDASRQPPPAKPATTTPFYGWDNKEPPPPIRVLEETTMDFPTYQLFQPEMPPKVRVTCRNGQHLARKAFCYARLTVVEFPAPRYLMDQDKVQFYEIVATENDLWDRFREEWLTFMERYPINLTDRIAGFEQPLDVYARGMMPHEEDNIHQGKEVIYIFGAAIWTDDKGKWETDLCTLLAGPVTSSPEKPYMWVQCAAGHNRVRYRFKR